MIYETDRDGLDCGTVLDGYMRVFHSGFTITDIVVLVRWIHHVLELALCIVSVVVSGGSRRHIYHIVVRTVFFIIMGVGSYENSVPTITFKEVVGLRAEADVHLILVFGFKTHYFMV